MSKPNFAAGLKSVKTETVAEAPPSPPPAPVQTKKDSRDGKVAIAAYFDPEVRTQLAIMAARQRTSQAALMAEALNLLFEKHGESAIARA